MDMPGFGATKKRQVVVVKAFHSSSVSSSSSSKPKKQFLVSHKPKPHELEYLNDPDKFETSYKGNRSPIKPEKDNKDHYLSRSILGEVAKYENFERLEMERDQAAMTSGNAASSSPSHSSSRATQRSSRSRGRNNRSSMTSGGGKSDEALKRKTALDKPSSQPEMYLKLLTEEKQTVKNNARRDKEEDDSWIEEQPYHEQLQILKEKKVLSRWQDRTKEWEKIEAQLMRKVNPALAPHTLMINSERQSEFRAQNERYSLMTAVVPAEERFSSTNWVMSLRGGGVTELQIGHLFSGLQCKVVSKVIIPPVVRKPKITSHDVRAGATGSYSKSVSFTRTNDFNASVVKTKTFKQIATELADKNNLIASRANKKREKAMATMRREPIPHETEGLFLKSLDLFDWAISSSTEYFAQKQTNVNLEQPSVSLIDAEHVDSLVDITASNKTSLADGGGVSTLSIQDRQVSTTPATASLEFISPREITMECRQGEMDSYYFEFTNTGSITIEYTWREDEVDAEIKSSNNQTVVNEKLLGRTKEETSRAKLLATSRPRFFCERKSGFVLPGETVQTPFSFNSDGCSGIFSQNWRLLSLPGNLQVSFKNELNAYNADSSRSLQPGQNYLRSFTPIKISFHGIAVFVDEYDHLRKITENVIAKRAVESLCADVVESCFRRVRTPMRIDVLNARKQSVFEDNNRSLLDDVSKRFKGQCVYYIDPSRIQAFIGLFHRSNSVLEEVKARRIELLRSLLVQEAYGVDVPEFLKAELIYTQEDMETLEKSEQAFTREYAERVERCIEAAKKSFFPEDTLEIFDEVCEADLENDWDYDVNAIISNMKTCMTTGRLIYHLEQFLALRKAAQAKAERKAAKIAANLAAIESDEEDDGDAYDVEDEEEEEEEEEEDDPKKIVDKATLHHLYLKSSDILNETYGKLNALVLRQVQTGSLSSRVSRALSWSLDVFESYDIRSRVDLDIDSESAIPSIPSPFTTEEGREKWDSILHAEEKVADPKGKKAPPAKKGGGGGEVSEETAAEYHKNLYDLVYKCLLDGMESALCANDLDLSLVTAEAVESSALGASENAAAIRKKDLSADKTCFVNFAGDAFLSKSSRDQDYTTLFAYPVYSGYDEISLLKKRALHPVLDLVKGGARSIVLTHESLRPSQSLLSHKEEICGLLQTLSPQMPLPVSREQRYRDRQIRRRERYLAKAAKRLARAERNLRRRNTPIEEDTRLLPMDEASLPPIDPYPEIYTYHLVPCKNFAELDASLKNSPARPDVTVTKEPCGGPLHDQVPQVVTLYLLEDMSLAGVAPPPLEYMEEESDDEDGVITIGYREFKESRKAAFSSLQPYRVEQRSFPGEIPRQILTDKHCALGEIIRNVKGPVPLLVEASPVGLFLPTRDPNFFSGTCKNIQISEEFIEREIPRKIIVSSQLREFLVWAGVTRTLPIYSLAKSLELKMKTTEKQGSLPTSYKGILEVRLRGGDNLPVMDRMGGNKANLSDPFVNVSLGKQLIESTRLTDTCSPSYNETLMMFWDEKETTLLVTVADDDKNKSDDPMGHLTIDLSKYDLLGGQVVVFDREPLEEVPESVDGVDHGTANLSLEVAYRRIPGIERINLQQQKDTTSGSSSSSSSSSSRSSGSGGVELGGESNEEEAGGEEIVEEQIEQTTAISGGFMGELCRLFPQPDPARFVAVIGGRLTTEKLRVMDQLIDSAHTIVVTGEVAIPFISLGLDVSAASEENQNNTSDSKSIAISLPKYTILCQQFVESCILLAKRARLRGVELILPTDFMVGEEEIEEVTVTKFYSKCDPEARDEGMEYEDETNVIDIMSQGKASLQGGEEAADIGAGSIVVNGYILDLGPNSIANAEAAIASSDLLLFWGTAGVCEAGSFQDGMRRLVVASAKTPWVPVKEEEEVEEGGGVKKPAAPAKVMVLGDTTTEWFLRFVDPDGSETQCDLVAGGVVNFACRDTVAIVGALGSYMSPALAQITRRAVEGEYEWKYDILHPVEEEEEEEEDDDDEEDDE